MQKSKKIGKLKLAKETLRSLAERELERVAGGIVETDTPSECFACAAAMAAYAY
jgi:natural product precursor